jgi:hypothetical protein
MEKTCLYVATTGRNVCTCNQYHEKNMSRTSGARPADSTLYTMHLWRCRCQRRALGAETLMFLYLGHRRSRDTAAFFAATLGANTLMFPYSGRPPVAQCRRFSRAAQGGGVSRPYCIATCINIVQLCLCMRYCMYLWRCHCQCETPPPPFYIHVYVYIYLCMIPPPLRLSIYNQ